MKKMQDIIDELIEKEYWVLDILPEQVPAESPGQYFAIEEYYLKPPNIDRIYEKFADILLKLNCYFDFSVIFGDDERIKNPEPELLGEMVKNCLPDKDSGGKYVCILNAITFLNPTQ